MTITCFSDTHLLHDAVELPECDIAIFAGDCTSRGQKRQLEDFIFWYGSQSQCKHKIWIAGNHDLSLDPKFDKKTRADQWLPYFWEEYRKYNDDVRANLIYLENEMVDIKGIRIWGSPITPDFFPQHWAFNTPRGEEIMQVWEHIPMHCDIVVTHGPCHGILDWVVSGHHVGCEDLRTVIETTRPKYHIAGHLHESYGTLQKDGITYINASICDERYRPINKPITFQL